MHHFCSILSAMDLNRAPSDLPISFSLGDIRFVCRTKLSCKEMLVRKYGEGGFENILSSPEPFLMPTTLVSRIVILVLV